MLTFIASLVAHDRAKRRAAAGGRTATYLNIVSAAQRTVVGVEIEHTPRIHRRHEIKRGHVPPVGEHTELKYMGSLSNKRGSCYIIDEETGGFPKAPAPVENDLITIIIT